METAKKQLETLGLMGLINLKKQEQNTCFILKVYLNICESEAKPSIWDYPKHNLLIAA